ncbi:MAG: putative DNA binding domain-containing protein [Planctomycetes bacterium]|nr:putative DNA binding domain-containing protein [Planctomycetota bacterium]
MTKTELLELLKNGENSGVEFKRDDVENHELAKEIVAVLNLEGGAVLLGIEDDGTVSGTSRPDLEEWVAELCRVKIEPPIVPHLTLVRAVEPGKDVLIVRVSQGPDKLYARVHNNRRTYFIRVGSTSREASREDLERMFQASGRVQYGLKPVPGGTLDDLDRRRLRDYFVRVLAGGAPDDAAVEEWERLLRNLDLMTVSSGQPVPTIDGMLLFGRRPRRFLPQSGIRALCYPGATPDYATRADEELKGPLVPLCAADGSITESGLVEQALDFVNRNTEPTAHLEGGRRVDRPAYPASVLREAIVNALVHRDYSVAGSDITLAIYSDRVEIQSPGRLPNTVTLEGMKAGMRYARNQTLVNVMRDYRYVDFRGMGVREKIIPGMRAHNGTEPEFIPEESRFTVRLWKEPKRS